MYHMPDFDGEKMVGWVLMGFQGLGQLLLLGILVPLKAGAGFTLARIGTWQYCRRALVGRLKPNLE